MATPLHDATLAADTWGISGGPFLAGYGALVVAAITLVFRAPRRLDRTETVPVDALRAVDLAFLNGADRLTVTSALASLRTAELIDDDARPTPPGHLGAGTPDDPVQAALLGALGRAADNPQARRLSTLIAHPAVYRAVRGVEAGLREQGLLRTAAEHASARRWALPLWVLVALGIARVVASVIDGRPYGWLLLVVALALIVALGTSMVGAAENNRAAHASLERARDAHHDLATTPRPTWPDFRGVDVGLGVALFGWSVLNAAMPPVAKAVVAHEVFSPNLGDSTVTG